MDSAELNETLPSIPRLSDFVEAFRKEYKGRNPSVYAAQAYDVIMAMDAAVKQAGGKVLPGERSQIAKNFKAPDGFHAAATARTGSAWSSA